MKKILVILVSMLLFTGCGCVKGIVEIENQLKIILGENGEVLTEEIDEIKENIETGTTKEIETTTASDLSKAASIEYSIINE